MISNAIQGGLIALSLLNFSATPTPTPEVKPQVVEERVYRLEKGDTLTSVAEVYYGDVDFWTTIWNDNPTIEDPYLIEDGLVLKLRMKKPENPEELKEVLKEKLPQSQSVAISVAPTAQPESTVTVSPAPFQAVANGPLNQTQIEYLGRCEAGLDPTKNTGNGYYGAFQFSYGTWKSMNTGYERADMAPLEVQIDAVQRLLQRSSIYTQFPGCARKMQAQGII